MGHVYLTAFADPDRPRVLYLAESREQENLDGFGPTLTPEPPAGIVGAEPKGQGEAGSSFVHSTRRTS